jgi:hypothetical protein
VDAVEFSAKFVSSRWFTRGWTLQELLAPRGVSFFGKQQTGAWTSNDQSIFAWIQSPTDSAATFGFEEIDYHLHTGEFRQIEVAGPEQKRIRFKAYTEHGLLADSPAAFLHSSEIIPWVHHQREQVPYQMTDRGLSIGLNLTPLSLSSKENIFLADIQCSWGKFQDDDDIDRGIIPMGVYLKETSSGPNQYARLRCDKLVKFEENDAYTPAGINTFAALPKIAHVFWAILLIVSPRACYDENIEMRCDRRRYHSFTPESSVCALDQMRSGPKHDSLVVAPVAAKPEGCRRPSVIRLVEAGEHKALREV